MTDTEKLVLFGLVGLIAWELWPNRQQAAPVAGYDNDPLSNTPPWIQQLATAEQFDCVETDDALDCLLSIPQGPGGTSNFPTNQPINFFNPTRGIFGACNQTPGNIVRPSLWSIA